MSYDILNFLLGNYSTRTDFSEDSEAIFVIGALDVSANYGRSHPPQNVSIIVSEEISPGWSMIYRGTVTTTGHDTSTLEEISPMWLLEYLLLNKIPPIPVVKLASYYFRGLIKTAMENDYQSY